MNLSESRAHVGRTLASAMALLTGLLALVVLAGRRPLDGHGSGPSLSGLQQPFYSVLLLAGTAALILLAALVWLLATSLRRRHPEDELVPAAPPKAHVWVLIPFVAALALGGWFVIQLLRSAHRRYVAPPLAPAGFGRLGRVSAANGFHLATGTILAGGAMSAALVLTVVALLWRWRRVPPAGAAERHDPLLEAVESSLADLDSAADPRLAVIRTYRRMQLALAGVSLDRRGSSESPREYLARARPHLSPGGGAEAEGLTELFEEARFSEHVIGEEMRTAATQRLTRMRSILRDLGTGANLGGER